MDVRGIDRVMLATHDIEATADRFRELLGIEFSDLSTVMPPEMADEWSVVLSRTGFQLVEPGSESGPVGQFLAENGPGVFAIGVRVGDLEATKAKLAEEDIYPLSEDTRENFAEAFYGPDNFNGVLTIFTEYQSPHPSIVAADSTVDYDGV